MTTASLSAAARDSDRNRLFYRVMAIAMAVTVFAGFAPTFFLKAFTQSPPLSPLLHVHGFLFASWYLLFFVQTTLVAHDRLYLHRKLGIAGACLVPIMVILGVAAAIHAIRTNHTPPGLDPRAFLVLPLFGVTVFATLAGFGVALRRRPETHKRLMLLASIAMLDAAIARLPGLLDIAGPLASFGLQDLFVSAAISYDYLTRRRVHRAYLLGGAFILLAQALRLIVAGTPWWLAFGDWLKG